jgi:hypothetical protein
MRVVTIARSHTLTHSQTQQLPKALLPSQRIGVAKARCSICKALWSLELYGACALFAHYSMSLADLNKRINTLIYLLQRMTSRQLH